MTDLALIRYFNGAPKAEDHRGRLWLHLTIFWFAFVRFPGHEDDSRFFWLATAAANAVAIAFWWLFNRHHRRIAARLKAVIRPTTEAGPAGAAGLAAVGMVMRAERDKLARRPSKGCPSSCARQRFC